MKITPKWPSGVLCTDVETNGLHPEHGHRPFLIGAMDEQGREKTVEYVEGAQECARTRAIRKAIEDPRRIKLAFNAKFEIRMFKRIGWKPKGTWLDPINMIVYLDEYSRLNLKALSLIHLNDRYEEEDTIKKWLDKENKRRRKPWLDALRKEYKERYGVSRVSECPPYQRAVKKGVGAPPEATYEDFYRSSKENERTMRKYLTKDLRNTLKLKWLFYPPVQKEWAANVKVETNLVPYVAGMEDAGLTIDAVRCRRMQRKYRRLRGRYLRSFFDRVGYELNLNSHPQLLRAFRRHGVMIPNTQKKTLEPFIDSDEPKHFIVKDLLEYRACVKALQYFDAFIDAGAGTGDRITVHASFWQNGQDRGIKTGRFSITDPAVQTLPGGYRGNIGSRGADVRSVIVPSGPDRVLVMIDYAQIEPRILVHYTGEPTLLRALNNGEDIYLTFVGLFFGQKALQADPATLKVYRDNTKTILLALMYGMGIQHMANQLGVRHGVAKGMRATALRRMPSIRNLMRACGRDIIRYGYCTDLFGRRYRVPANLSYKGINAIIQGGAAHIMKRAIVSCGDLLTEWNSTHGYHARMLLTVHDELIFDMRKEHMPTLTPLLINAMETVAPELNVPLEAEASWSAVSWADKQALDLAA